MCHRDSSIIMPPGNHSSICSARASHSPGKRLPKVEITTGRSVVGQGGQLHARFAAFGEFHRGSLSAHVGFHPAGVGGIYFDPSPTQFLCKMDGERIQGSLRSVVSEGLLVVDG